MKFDLANGDFVAGARAWLRSLPDEAVVNFSSVLELSPGYYPTTLRDLWWQELQRRGLQPIEDTSSLVSTASFPVGHPLDYDWRFSPATRAVLNERLVASTFADDRIAYLGTPTLFADAVARMNDRRHWLFDANESIVASLQQELGPNAVAVYLRLGGDKAPEGINASAAVLDPPWYPDDTRDFLTAAAALSKPGAVVLLSQPTLATRPGVAAEREKLLLMAGDLGFHLTSIEDGALKYVTPHFERMSLIAEEPGIVVPGEWRRGDLFSLIRTDQPVDSVRGSHPHLYDWREVSFGPVRIKLRRAGGSDLEPVEPGLDRLITVSRRDPMRDRVGFWTSGNRVRTLDAVDDIARLVMLCDNDFVHMTFTQQNIRTHAMAIGTNRRVADELFGILLLEYQEHVASGYGVLE